MRRLPRSAAGSPKLWAQAAEAASTRSRHDSFATAKSGAVLGCGAATEAQEAPMTFLESRDVQAPTVTPALMVGAASPLWGYFAGAAATGMAYWWMTRWAHPANLEAFFAAATTPFKAAEAET